MSSRLETLAERHQDSQRQNAELEHQLLAEKHRLIGSFKRLFSTPDGKVVLSHLHSRYRNRSIVIPNDPVSTHARAGNVEVIDYIDSVIATDYGDAPQQAEVGGDDG